MTTGRIIELLEIEHQCIVRNTNNECDRDCAKCDLVQDDVDLDEMYTNVIFMLKENEPVKAHRLDSPRITFHGKIVFDGICGYCSGYLKKNWKSCPLCGKRVEWI